MDPQADLELQLADTHNLKDMMDGLEIVYDGPSLSEGRIDLGVLGDGIKGLSTLCQRVSRLLLGSDQECQLQLSSRIEFASVHIPIEVVHHFIDVAESVLASKHLDALERLCTLLGFGIGTPIISLYALFRRKKGRPISEEDNLAELLKLFPSNIDAAVLIKIFNDPEVQAAIRASLRPLREPGVEQFQTRRRGTIIDRVSKADLLVADEAELDAESKTTEEVLNIEKVALLPHLSWHFSNKEGSFDAKIEDKTLWNEIENGEQFGYGDTMKVILATTASRTSQGKLIKNRTIPKVLFVSHVGQKSLPLPRTE